MAQGEREGVRERATVPIGFILLWINLSWNLDQSMMINSHTN